MGNINTRTRIEFRWSTEPKHVGYGDATDDPLRDRQPDFIGTPRQVLAEAARVRQNIGEGVFCAMEFCVHNDPIHTEIPRIELEELAHHY